MARRAGWSDRARLINSSETDVTANVGVIRGASHEITRGGIQAVPAVNQGSKTAYISEGLREHLGSITLETDNFYILRAFGEVSGTDLVNVDELPTWTYQNQASDSEYIEITGFKFGNITVSLESGGYLEISTDGQGLAHTIETGLLSKEEYANDPENVGELTVQIDGSTLGALQSLELQINRNIEARGDVGVASKDPQAILEGTAEVTINSLVIDIEDTDAYDRIDNASSHTIKIILSNGEELQLNGVEFDNVNPDEQTGEGVRTLTQTGIAIDWQVNNIGGT